MRNVDARGVNCVGIQVWLGNATSWVARSPAILSRSAVMSLRSDSVGALPALATALKSLCRAEADMESDSVITPPLPPSMESLSPLPWAAADLPLPLCEERPWRDEAASPASSSSMPCPDLEVPNNESPRDDDPLAIIVTKATTTMLAKAAAACDFSTIDFVTRPPRPESNIENLPLKKKTVEEKTQTFSRQAGSSDTRFGRKRGWVRHEFGCVACLPRYDQGGGCEDMVCFWILLMMRGGRKG